MNRNKYIVFAFLGLCSIVFLLLVMELTQEKQKIEAIQFAESITTGDLTLLERMHVDVDSDDRDESIELYTSAQRGPDGIMMWDDGQRWLLLVRDERKISPLFDGYVQLGQLEFWVGFSNKYHAPAPKSKDLEKHIYVMRTGHGIQLADYYWDKRNLCFNKEIVFDPPDQWNLRSSYKYSYDRPVQAEPAK